MITPSLKNTYIIIAGPTASGKSQLALELALHLGNAEIINADSMQLYKDLSVLTARPSLNPSSFPPHHLYGVLTCHEISSAVWWIEQVTELIKDCFKRNNIPIVVGGTGLYLQGLTQGLSPAPSIDPDIRSFVRKEALERKENFYKFVYEKDPLLSSHLNPNDHQRLCRALEVMMQTGQSIISLQGNMKPPLPHSYHYFVIEPERSWLKEWINHRFLNMIEKGAIEEVEHLFNLNPSANCPLLKAIGVKEIKTYLENQISKEYMIEKAQQSSRQYAKRQMTWFRHQVEKKIVIREPNLATLWHTFASQ